MRALTRLFALLLFAGCTAAVAHERSESYSNWHISDDRMTGVITVSQGEIMALVELDNTRTLDALFADHARERVSVQSESGRCELAEPVSLEAARGFLRTELRFSCGGSTPTQLHYRALLDELPAHVHYARIEEHGALLAEVLITDRADRWQRVTKAAGQSRSFSGFLDLGVRHILSGYDHIAFLIGLLLLAGTLGRSVAAVTGFTLGHSASLAAAVLGYVHADGRIVEAIIGFTVALVAVEYFVVRGRSGAPLPLITGLSAWVIGALAISASLIDGAAAIAYLGIGLFAVCYLAMSVRVSPGSDRVSTAMLFVATTCFGLIHGFGFAGFLMQTGIEGSALLLPLLGFNIGVELGQLTLIAVAFLLAWCTRKTNVGRLAPLAAAGLTGIGVYWFVGRSLGGL